MNNGKKNDIIYNIYFIYVILFKIKDVLKIWNIINNDNKFKFVNIEISIKDIKWINFFLLCV